MTKIQNLKSNMGLKQIRRQYKININFFSVNINIFDVVYIIKLQFKHRIIIIQIIQKNQLVFSILKSQMQQQFQLPQFCIDFQSQPLQNQSLVIGQQQLIFPKVDLVIDKNGITQLSNPQNTLTKFKIIPKYMTQLEVIGRGSAGTVKRAIYTFDGKQTLVAIKQITAQDKQKRDQLLNDLRTFLTGQMSDYVVKFYGCYYHEGAVKQVIQFMNLGSLKNITNLVSQGILSIDEQNLAQIIRRILQGLKYIHKVKHQIHRDIKPQNILINDLGQIKITDFGITKYIENTFGQAQTFVGTTIYMSPQRIGISKKYDYKCDIWSLGLIVYELATGQQLPYKTSKKQPIMALLNKIVSQNPPNLQNYNRSAQLKDFLNLCLQKNPQSRSSVDQLLQHPWILNNAGKVQMQDFMINVKSLLKKN